MSDGLIRISVSAKDGNSTYDYESGGDISGGVFIATGSASVVSIPTATSQGVISVNAGSKEAGVEVKVEDETGTAILIENPTNDFEICIISTPKIVKGKTYKVFIGNDSGNFTAK
jgi:type 1 fimbria pilin